MPGPKPDPLRLRELRCVSLAKQLKNEMKQLRLNSLCLLHQPQRANAFFKKEREFQHCFEPSLAKSSPMIPRAQQRRMKEGR